MHGCGVRLSKDASGDMKALEGKFFADEYVGPILPCSSQDCLDAAVEADVAAHQAQSYRGHAAQQQQQQAVSCATGVQGMLACAWTACRPNTARFMPLAAVIACQSAVQCWPPVCPA
jgi:hypothetical protein